jgi:polysaccharide biosynthesis protein PslG
MLFLLSLPGCGKPPMSSPGVRARARTHDTLRQVPFGLCEDYPEEVRTIEEARRDFRLLADAGASVLRVSIGWDGVEPEKDRYELAFWDDFVALADELGIVLIPYIAYTPRWNSDGGPDDYWKAPPRDLNEFAEIVTLLATRYRGRIRSWELWNEPDNRDYWLGSATQYAELVRAGAAAVHTVDPRISVVSGGLAGGVDFFRELFAQPGMARVIDVVNLHSYYETWNPNPLESIPGYVDAIGDIIAERGGRQALWMAEVGYSNFLPVNAASPARYGYEHSVDFQAVMVVRTLALLLSQPAVSLVAWYELKDPRPTDAMIGDDNNRHLGVAYADYRPKPALAAFSFMNRSFAPGFRSVDAELRLPDSSRASDPELELHGFVTAQHTLLLISWLRTRTTSAVPEATLTDTRRRLVQVSAPYAARGAPVAFDERGRTRPRAVELRAAPPGHSTLSFDVRGGGVTITELPIAE